MKCKDCKHDGNCEWQDTPSLDKLTQEEFENIDACAQFEPKDVLAAIFEMQLELQKAAGFDIFYRNRFITPSPLMLDSPRQDFISLQFMGIITEACEALENTPWKPWKQSMRLNKEKFREELIDLLHFVVNMFLAAGMTPEEIYKAFKEKHRINMKRQEGGY